MHDEAVKTQGWHCGEEGELLPLAEEEVGPKLHMFHRSSRSCQTQRWARDCRGSSTSLERWRRVGGSGLAELSNTSVFLHLGHLGQPSETVFKKVPRVFIPVKALGLLGRSRPGCVSWTGSVLVDLNKASERTPTVPGFRPIFHPSKLSNKKFTSMTPRLLLDAYLTGQVVSHWVIWNHQRSHLLPSQLSSDRTGSYLAFFLI